MPRPRKTEEEIAEMRQCILDAATELLEEEGPEALSIRRIAKRVGVSHMALYTYFENRGALLTALKERHLGHMRTRRAGLLQKAETGDALTTLRDSLAFYIHFAHTRPRLYQVAWVQPFKGGLFREPPQNLERNLKHLAGLIELCIERGQCVDRDSCVAAATAFCIVNGPQILYHNGRLSDETLRDQVEAEVLDVAMKYLCGSDLP